MGANKKYVDLYFFLVFFSFWCTRPRRAGGVWGKKVREEGRVVSSTALLYHYVCYTLFLNIVAWGEGRGRGNNNKTLRERTRGGGGGGENNLLLAFAYMLLLLLLHKLVFNDASLHA